jgi:hypothetical protein
MQRSAAAGIPVLGHFCKKAFRKQELGNRSAALCAAFAALFNDRWYIPRWYHFGLRS